ncbi:MAG: hypothetical protein K5842_08260 [Bacteroidales bacterium]|nr:hypothetical protein [Bacteroidales bacterium]
MRKWRQENSERQGVKKRGHPSEARFLALALTPLFLDISSAVLLRQTEPFSFATFLFGSGKRKVEKIDKKVKEKSFATLRQFQKVGTFWVSARKSTGLTHIFGSGQKKDEISLVKEMLRIPFASLVLIVYKTRCLY